jgi:uncharacterized protein (DUF1778 family)
MTLRQPRKQERLVARATAADKAVIAHAAALAGQSVGSFLVAEARKAALLTIETRERIVLNAEQSRRFVEALLAPPRPPTPEMLAAMRAYKATVKSDLDQPVHPLASRSHRSVMGINKRRSSSV